jgi:hypothetical protein
LILAGKPPRLLKDGRSGKLLESWQKWFEAALELTETHKQQGSWQDTAGRLRVTIHTEVDDAPTVEAPPISVPAVALDLQPLSVRSLPSVLAADRLLAMRALWRVDPSVWRLSYRDGLRPELPPATACFDGSFALSEAVRERLTALLARRAVALPRVSAERQTALLRAWAGHWLAAQEPDGEFLMADLDVVVAQARELAERLRTRGPGLRKLLTDGPDEVPFALRLGAWRIEGRFDQLLGDESGRTLVDCSILGEEQPSNLLRQHQPRLQLQALALQRTGQAALVEGKIEVQVLLLAHAEVQTVAFAPGELEEFAEEIESDLEAMVI